MIFMIFIELYLLFFLAFAEKLLVFLVTCQAEVMLNTHFMSSIFKVVAHGRQGGHGRAVMLELVVAL